MKRAPRIETYERRTVPVQKHRNNMNNECGMKIVH